MPAGSGSSRQAQSEDHLQTTAIIPSASSQNMSLTSTSNLLTQTDFSDPSMATPGDLWTGHPSDVHLFFLCRILLSILTCYPQSAPEYTGVLTVAQIKRPLLNKHSMYSKSIVGTGKPYLSSKVVVPRVHRPETDSGNFTAHSTVGHLLAGICEWVSGILYHNVYSAPSTPKMTEPSAPMNTGSDSESLMSNDGNAMLPGLELTGSNTMVVWAPPGSVAASSPAPALPKAPCAAVASSSAHIPPAVTPPPPVPAAMSTNAPGPPAALVVRQWGPVK